MRRSIRTEYRFISLSAPLAAFAVSYCSKQTSFKPVSQRIESPRVHSQDDEAAEFPEILKFRTQVDEVERKELLGDAKNRPKIESYTFDDNSFGLAFNPSDDSVTWTGRLFTMEAAVDTALNLSLVDGTTESIQIKLSSFVPPQPTKSCFVGGDPVIGDVKPELAWHWKGFLLEDGITRYATTYSAPVVGNLDMDEFPEVVTVVSKIGQSEYNDKNGALVVLDGISGAVKWNSLVDSGIEVEASSTPALIDLDRDGLADIIAVVIDNPVATNKTRSVIAINPRKRMIMWKYSENFLCGVNCLVAVGDIDNDGLPEVVAGNVILSSNGVRKSFLLDQIGNPPRVNLRGRNNVAIAPLDRDVGGYQIISNGSQVFSSAGKFLWQGECEGFSAVADLDRDGKNELVCIGGGKVFHYSAKGDLTWSKDIPSNPDLPAIPPDRFRGGAPNIGNFDDDPEFEIGTAGGDFYVVFDHRGEIVWKTATTDRSSHATGSTIFDFNGDGKVEVVYNDEKKLRIYDGNSGKTLWEVDNKTGTLWEYPLIVNLDQNSSVEIVASAAGIHNVDDPEQGGIKVFRDPNQKWISSRRVWNQYNYFPELVSDKLTAIPPSGKLLSGFRTNSPIFDFEKTLQPSLRWDIAYREIDPLTNQPLLFVANTSMIDSNDSTRLTFEKPSSGESLLDKDIVGVIKPGSGKLMRLSTDVSQESMETMKIKQPDLKCK